MSTVCNIPPIHSFHRHPWLTRLGLLVAGLALSLGLLETGLRLAGVKPQDVRRYRNYRPLQHITVEQSFFTDENGVFKANPRWKFGDPSFIINSDGFRGTEFKKEASSRKTILFLGASHAWGASAKPITNSFVDIVSRHGYVAYNAGIPGTSPEQFAYLAEKYVPLLRPDFVAVIFSMETGFVGAKYRRMLPNKNLFYITTSGQWINAFDHQGHHFTFEEAVNRYNQRATPRRYLSYTVTGAFLFAGLSELKHRLGASAGLSRENNRSEERNPRPYLQRISSVCRSNNCRFLLFVMPVPKYLESPQTRVKDNMDILRDFSPFVPGFLNATDYPPHPDSHLNNSGHQKYADFIMHVLKRQPARTSGDIGHGSYP